MNRRLRRVLRFVMFAVVGVAVLALLGIVVMSLWNWLTPGIFGWKAIGYWQALGLIILCRLLFGRFGAPMGGGRWRHRMRERWERMTPEEREKFRQGICGQWGRATSGPGPAPGA